MIKVSQLMEISEKRGTIAFMRANPPTSGHAKVVDLALAEPGIKRVYVSHTQDNKSNPLTPDEKIHMLHTMYPNHKALFRQSSKEEPTIFHAAARMHREGIKHLTVVAGEDRVKEFQDKLDAYNGKFDKNGNGYNFKSIHVKSAGVRDPDAEGAEGISGTKMREAALSGKKQDFRKGLHHNISNKDADELMEKIKSRIKPKTIREQYLDEEIFNIGDIVKSDELQGEIIARGSNYVTIVSEGIEHKCWLETLKEVDATPKRDQVYKESFIFKGYKTKNFTRSLSESFKDIAKNTDDSYALLNYIKSLDYLLGCNNNSITENFSVVRIQTERARRYSKKIGLIKLTEALISVIEEDLLRYAVMENVKFTTTDRNMIARVISSTAGIINNTSASPENEINNAATSLRKEHLTNPGWELLGRMFNMATQAGIKWNKDIFSNSIQTLMGLK